MTVAIGGHSATMLGVKLEVDFGVDSDGEILVQPATLPAIAVTTWTKSGNYAGSALVATSGGITTSSQVDMYWLDANNVQRCAANLTVGTVSGSAPNITMPITGANATGDYVPANGTVVTICKQQPVAVAVDASKLSFLGVSAPEVCAVRFVASGSEQTILCVPPTASASTPTPKGGTIWASSDSAANPLGTMVVVSATVSTRSTSSQIVTIASLYDSTT